MKKAFYILLFCTLSTLTVRAQYKYVKFSAHKTSLGFTLIQGLSDGLRDASMFGRVKGGRWFNEDLHSWQLKYKDGDCSVPRQYRYFSWIIGLPTCCKFLITYQR
jgi:hypothetical protein